MPSDKESSNDKCDYKYICVYVHVSVWMLSRIWLCDPIDCRPPGSSVHGVSQARMLEWVTVSFSRGSSWSRNQTCSLLHWQADSLPTELSGKCVLVAKSQTRLSDWLFATPWAVDRQAPLSMGFSRQEYQSRLPCHPPGDLPDPS